MRRSWPWLPVCILATLAATRAQPEEWAEGLDISALQTMQMDLEEQVAAGASFVWIRCTIGGCKYLRTLFYSDG